jgi:hypothetical protein
MPSHPSPHRLLRDPGAQPLRPRLLVVAQVLAQQLGLVLAVARQAQLLQLEQPRQARLRTGPPMHTLCAERSSTRESRRVLTKAR